MTAGQLSPLTETTTTETIRQEMVDCMASSHGLRDQEIRFVLDAVSVKLFKKGSILLHEGQIPAACYSNYQGCVRQFYLKNGEEKTTFFYTEGQQITTITSKELRKPVKFYLECVEDTFLTIMPHESELELFRRYPKFEAYGRLDMERRLMEYQEMLASYIITTPEERYLNVLKDRPELVHRVPQYQLASFLGIKPESLSRIRKRIMMRA